MSNNLAFIISYFGKLPSYFPLFVNSVKDKPFDILFFSDIKKPESLPKNIIWIPFTFAKLQDLFSQKLEMDIKIKNPYKLCEYKPCYGLCFEEYLKEYDFWGSLDTDTVMGNFEKFVPQTLLNEIDLYSSVKEYISGALFIIRNNNDCNNLFKKSKDWKNALLNESYVGFDECGGHYFEQLKSGADIFELNTPIESFTEVVFRETKQGFRVHLENSILEPKGAQYVEINKDEILYGGKEYLLLHYIYLKSTYYFYINTSISNIRSFYFNSLGNFDSKPTRIKMLFSKNMVHAIQKKIKINLKKFNF